MDHVARILIKDKTTKNIAHEKEGLEEMQDRTPQYFFLTTHGVNKGDVPILMLSWTLVAGLCIDKREDEEE